MKKILFIIFIGWVFVCGFSVFDKNIVDSPPVQAVFGEILDDEKVIEIDFSKVLTRLKEMKFINKELEIRPIIISKQELLSLIIQGISFFILGIILLAIFNVFSKFILYPTIVFGGIIIFLLHYFKILTVKEMFDWVKFYLNYLSLATSALLGSFIKKLKKVV